VPAGLASLLRDCEPKCLVTEQAALPAVRKMQSERELREPY